MFKLRILIVEDSDDDTQLMVREIRRGGYDVEWERIETRAAMESALVRQAWDLVISDHKMPQFSSTQALEVLNESGQDLPLLIISGSIGEEAAVAALKAGAHDFMTKGNLARLIPAIQRELKEAETRRERKKAEAALRATEARLSGILDLAADAVIVIDGHQRMILFNQSAEHIFGYKADEVLGQALEILLPSHLDKIHYEHVNAFRTAPEIRQHLGEQLEIFGRRKDGSEFPAEASISKLKQGDEITFTVIMRDITERKQAEEALRESNARFRSLFENTPVSIWEEDFSAVKAYLDSLADVQNPDLETYLNEHPEVVSKCVRLVKVQSVNQAALELHGAHTKAELLEKLEKTFTPKSFETFKKELLAIARGEHQMEMDEEVQTLSGEKREATLRWIVAPGHEITYSKVLVSLVDITERKQRERELEAIASASSALRVAKTLDELLSRLLGQALALVEGEVGSIWLFDPSADRVDLAVHRGWQTDNIATSVKPGQGVPGLVVQNGETIVSREFRSDPRVIAENRDQIPKGAGGACVPLFKETEGHTIRVTETTLELARIIGMSDDELVHIRRGGLLHDIGKMGVPDKILLKPDKLTEDEWLVMRKHPEYAYKMLVPIAYLHQALDIPYCHHEKWDGTGYPRGLNREQIPLAARVFAVADVWDALTSDRPYRRAWSTDKALKYIREQSGQHFDPQVVEVFLQTVRADKINLFSP